MKKIISILLAVLLLAAPMTVYGSAGNRTESAAPVMEETTNPEGVFLAGSVPADSALTDAIVLPLHALVLAMLEHELVYDIRSAPFVWTALYYSLSLYGQTDDRAELTQNALVLPSESVHDFSRALFADLEQLPELPPELKDFIGYDQSRDLYSLALGDFALTELQMNELIRREDGLYSAEGVLASLEDNSPLCSFRVTLVENDTMFGFSVLDMCLF